MKLWIPLILAAAAVAVIWNLRSTRAPAPIATTSQAVAPAPANTAAASAPVGIPAFQGGGALLGVAEPIAPPPYQVRWQFKAGGEDRASIDNNPVIAGDT